MTTIELTLKFNDKQNKVRVKELTPILKLKAYLCKRYRINPIHLCVPEIDHEEETCTLSKAFLNQENNLTIIDLGVTKETTNDYKPKSKEPILLETPRNNFTAKKRFERTIYPKTEITKNPRKKVTSAWSTRKVIKTNNFNTTRKPKLRTKIIRNFKNPNTNLVSTTTTTRSITKTKIKSTPISTLEKTTKGETSTRTTTTRDGSNKKTKTNTTIKTIPLTSVTKVTSNPNPNKTVSSTNRYSIRKVRPKRSNRKKATRTSSTSTPNKIVPNFETRNSVDINNIRISRNTRNSTSSRNSRNSRNSVDTNNTRISRNTRNSRNSVDVNNTRNSIDTRNSRGPMQYQKETENIIKRHHVISLPDNEQIKLLLRFQIKGIGEDEKKYNLWRNYYSDSTLQPSRKPLFNHFRNLDKKSILVQFNYYLFNERQTENLVNILSDSSISEQIIAPNLSYWITDLRGYSFPRRLFQSLKARKFPYLILITKKNLVANDNNNKNQKHIINILNPPFTIVKIRNWLKTHLKIKNGNENRNSYSKISNNTQFLDQRNSEDLNFLNENENENEYENGNDVTNQLNRKETENEKETETETENENENQYNTLIEDVNENENGFDNYNEDFLNENTYGIERGNKNDVTNQLNRKENETEKETETENENEIEIEKENEDFNENFFNENGIERGNKNGSNNQLNGKESETETEKENEDFNENFFNENTNNQITNEKEVKIDNDFDSKNENQNLNVREKKKKISNNQIHFPEVRDITEEELEQERLLQQDSENGSESENELENNIIFKENENEEDNNVGGEKEEEEEGLNKEFNSKKEKEEEEENENENEQIDNWNESQLGNTENFELDNLLNDNSQKNQWDDIWVDSDYDNLNLENVNLNDDDDDNDNENDIIHKKKTSQKTKIFNNEEIQSTPLQMKKNSYQNSRRSFQFQEEDQNLTNYKQWMEDQNQETNRTSIIRDEEENTKGMNIFQTNEDNLNFKDWTDEFQKDIGLKKNYTSNENEFNDDDDEYSEGDRNGDDDDEDDDDKLNDEDDEFDEEDRNEEEEDEDDYDDDDDDEDEDENQEEFFNNQENNFNLTQTKERSSNNKNNQVIVNIKIKDIKKLFSHTFNISDRLGAVMSWIESENPNLEEYAFIQSYPRNQFTKLEKNKTLREIGLGSKKEVLLFVR
ncbi:origin recognition complex subunit [Anaeramoeba flamelloides]|uniref:Origin recognition complex subunit n=1 Tax=Anaeramoeba flamelloides TaxID=1746091 RepID=A0AAV7ZYK8_9EUKA|nr:origin recognition complex subunit [Anaeramoeba flamelloides]